MNAYVGRADYGPPTKRTEGRKATPCEEGVDYLR